MNKFAIIVFRQINKVVIILNPNRLLKKCILFFAIAKNSILFCITEVDLIEWESMRVVNSLLDPVVAVALMSGGVVVMPTDTVYGLVARAADAEAIAKLYGLKPRDRQPGTMIAANIQQLHDIGFADAPLQIADAYWPDALSVVLDATSVARYLKDELPDLAVRIPNHRDLLELLHTTGPLMTTSANLPAQPTATSVREAWAYFGNGIDLYVDGGPIAGHQPSTIIRIDNNAITVLRRGAVKI